MMITIEDMLNLEAAKAGYHHKLDGEGFHPGYETASSSDQVAYELGRLMAVLFGPGAYYVTLDKGLALSGQALARMCTAHEERDAHPTLPRARRSTPGRSPAPAAPLSDTQ